MQQQQDNRSGASTAAGRLHVVARQQLAAAEAAAEEQQLLMLNPTSGGDDAAERAEALMRETEPYAVPLPETLRPHDQPWQVYRCGLVVCTRERSSSMWCVTHHAGRLTPLVRLRLACARLRCAGTRRPRAA
jgi:hypothetical protein